MLSRIIATAILVSYLFIYKPLGSSAAEDQTSRYPKMLRNMKTEIDIEEKFLENLRSISQKNSLFRTVILIGGSAESLDNAKSLFKDYPVAVCTNSARCLVYEISSSRGNLVVIFLDGISGETLSKNAVILSCEWCGILYITERNIDDKKMIPLTLESTMKQKIPKVIFAQLDKSLQLVKLYGYVVATDCSMEIRMENVWTPGKRFDFFGAWNHRSKDFKGCKVTVSTCNFAPKMITEELDDGSEVVTGGVEGYLLLTLAENLNFTMAIRSPSRAKQSKYSRRKAIINELITGRADLAIGGLRTDIGVPNLYSSMAYGTECTVWVVPRKTAWVNAIPFMIFRWRVWGLIGLVYVAVCLFAYILQKIDSQRTRFGKHVEFSTTVVDVVALHLGNPIVNMPVFAVGRIIFVMFLCYALIVTTAFKTSLASILVADSGSQVINDAEGIISGNLIVGGASYNLDFLKDQVNESDTVAKLVDRFVVMNDPAEALRRFRMDDNFAFIARRSSVVYNVRRTVKAREPTFYVYLNDCVLKYYTVISSRYNSQLLEAINTVIMRLNDFGILSYWESLEVVFDKVIKYELNNPGCSESCMSEKFRSIFLLYIICIASSILVFFMELFVKKYRPNLRILK